MPHALSDGLEYMQGQPEDSLWQDMAQDLRRLGFEPGWGRSKEQMQKSFSRLDNLLEAPDHRNLERFISAIPMI